MALSHRGMEEVNPRGQAALGVGKEVDVLIGEPLDLQPLLDGAPLSQLPVCAGFLPAHVPVKQRLCARSARTVSLPSASRLRSTQRGDVFGSLAALPLGTLAALRGRRSAVAHAAARAQLRCSHTASLLPHSFADHARAASHALPRTQALC